MEKPTNFFSALRFPGRLLKAKSFVFIVSAQRSGSTLLKALLAVAPDVSHLPEVPFHLYGSRSAWQLKTLSDKPIIVLKKPSWPDEFNYPQIPSIGPQKILLLIRHPYETLVSTGKMYEAMDSDFWQKWDYENMLYDYWLPTYEGILARNLQLQPNVCIIRYEALVSKPIEYTSELFRFIGSKQKKGTNTYLKRSENWTFMKDDGSDRINSLKVQSNLLPRDNEQLLNLLRNEPRVSAVLSQYGYKLDENNKAI